MAQPTHHLPTFIGGSNTWAFWATQPRKIAILFVHGFGGHALNTWGDFPKMLQDSPKINGVDLLFFGYSSRTVRANLSAAKLYHFLKALANCPKDFVTNTLGNLPERAQDFCYDKIVIVSHSLGGALCRKVVIDYERSRLAPELELVLFAPAHKGASILGLLQQVLTVIPTNGLMSNIATYYFPVLQDLEKNSVFLNDIESQTKRYLQFLYGVGPYSQKTPLIADKIVFGDNDKVVHQDTFAEDWPSMPYPGKGHVDICKPNASFDAPVQVVVNAL